MDSECLGFVFYPVAFLSWVPSHTHTEGSQLKMHRTPCEDEGPEGLIHKLRSTGGFQKLGERLGPT